MWTFKNTEVAENFNEHVREQLPWYEMVTEFIVHIITSYSHDGSRIYDLGCSTGNLENELSELIANRNIEYIPIDNSQEMIEQYITTSNTKPILANIQDFEYGHFDIAVLNLTLMFLSYDEKQSLLKKLHSKMNQYAIIIVIDKYLTTKDLYFNQVLHNMTLRMKLRYSTAENILSKELSLRGVQFPMLEKLISQEFQEREKFFQFGNFIGHVLFK